MKNSVIVATLMFSMLIATSSFAQFNQGRLIVDGSLRFARSSGESTSASTTSITKNTSFGLSPSVGYFVIDNFAIGATASLNSSKSTNDVINSEAKSVSKTVGPFARYYLPMAIFIQGAVTFGASKFATTTPSDAFENKSNITQWGLGVGYAYFLNDFVALEPMVGYQSTVDKSKTRDFKTKDGNIYLSAAFTIYLGERK
jgi:hypothetical protein